MDEQKKQKGGNIYPCICQLLPCMSSTYKNIYEAEEYAKKEDRKFHVTYEYYREYFNTHFNLGFGVPSSDTCGTCDAINIKIQEAKSTEDKHRLEEEKESHLRKSQQFYSEIRTCTEMAKQSTNMACLSFDFEQNFPLPHIPTNEIFYLRQLWLYVFCIHDITSGKGNLYCWPETTVHRGSNEVASVPFHYLKKLKDIDTVYLFSDSCGGQNKNTNIIHFLYLLVKQGNFKRIQHVFPVRGHSFLPCDRDFGLIEQKKRRVDRIYTPNQCKT